MIVIHVIRFKLFTDVCFFVQEFQGCLIESVISVNFSNIRCLRSYFKTDFGTTSVKIEAFDLAIEYCCMREKTGQENETS